MNNFIIHCIFASDPFDCYSDPCHLACLLRDNRDLLSIDELAEKRRCSDGPAFTDLSPSLFEECSFNYI